MICLGMRDVSFPGVRRKLVDVEVDRALDRETLIDEARLALAEVAKYGHAQAFGVFFWSAKQRREGLVGKEKALASVDFAPGGKWEDANKAKLGEYDTHRFRVEFNDTDQLG